VPTPAVRHHIREGSTHQIPSAIQTGSKWGMQTMDAALADLVRGGRITRELALTRCSNPDTFARLLEQPAAA
jgi:twitching motility protein PilT